MLVDVQPLAILSSVSGTMHFYSIEALQLWTDKESELVVQLNASTPKIYSTESTEGRCEYLHVDTKRISSQELSQGATHQGYSLEQWVKYARKKSAIASATCRHNGELRRRLGGRGSPSLLSAIAGFLILDSLISLLIQTLNI